MAAYKVKCRSRKEKTKKPFVNRQTWLANRIRRYCSWRRVCLSANHRRTTPTHQERYVFHTLFAQMGNRHLRLSHHDFGELENSIWGQGYLLWRALGSINLLMLQPAQIHVSRYLRKELMSLLWGDVTSSQS